jgi:hypothetical protein
VQTSFVFLGSVILANSILQDFAVASAGVLETGVPGDAKAVRFMVMPLLRAVQHDCIKYAD